MEKENQKSTIGDNKKKFKKLYILKKNKDVSDLIKVKDSFLDPKQYFKKQKSMIIGDLHSKTTLDQVQKTKSLSISHSLYASPVNNITRKNEQKFKNKFLHKSKSLTLKIDSKNKTKKQSKYIRNYSSKNNYDDTKKNTSYAYLNNLENSNSKSDFRVHYQIKSLGDILNILRKYKNLEEENKSKRESIVFGNKNISSEIIKEIGKNLSGQEKILFWKKKAKDFSDSFSKNISKKIKRKENDLLYNKIEEYRLKQQFLDIIEKTKSIRDKFGDNYWVADLRRPKIQKEIRFLYSNTNKNNKPPDLLIDYGDKDIEFISDPLSQNNSKYINFLKNINNYRKIHKFKFPNVENVAQIGIVEGKHLLSQELNVIKENKNNRKYKLYKDPLESNKNNMKDIICKESFDVKYRIQKNRSYTNEENKIQNFNISNKNKRKELYRCKSAIGGFKKNNNNKNNRDKVNNLKDAFKLLNKENKERESSIKIIPYK